MFKIDDAADFRRTVGGACLVVAPFLFATAELVEPESGSNSAAAQLAMYRGHHAAIVVGTLATLAMTMTLLAGTFALVHLLRTRGVVLGHVALAFVVYGLVTAHAALAGANLVMSLMAGPGLDHAAMLQLMNRVFHESAAFPLLLGHYVFTLGILLLGIALLRGHIGPRWAAWCVIAFPVTDALVSMVPVDRLSGIVSNGFGIAGFVGLGIYLFRLPNSAWFAPPAPQPAVEQRVSV